MTTGLIISIVVFTVILIGVLIYYVPIDLLVTAQFSGVRVSVGQMIGMRLRKVEPKSIVNEMIKATKAGLIQDEKGGGKEKAIKELGEGEEKTQTSISLNSLEAHYLAGGNVSKVVDALISANNANIDLDFGLAAAIDLAGRDVLQAVKDSVNTKVIDSPIIEAVAKDGIQLKVVARITVRAHLQKLVGGAGEDTVVARIGQGVVSAIGSVDSHKEILENPGKISEKIMDEGLQVATAYELISVDIADIDVGKNIGADLEKEKAFAEMETARAKAAERQAEAEADEQYYRARVQEMRAKLIESEAQLPEAISKAFKDGNLGVMDYYRLKNVQADTDMRNAFSGINDDKSDLDDQDGPSQEKDDKGKGD